VPAISAHNQAFTAPADARRGGQQDRTNKPVAICSNPREMWADQQFLLQHPMGYALAGCQENRNAHMSDYPRLTCRRMLEWFTLHCWSRRSVCTFW